MKVFQLILLAAVSIGSLSCDASAQRRDLSKEEFDTISNTAFSKTETLVHREISESKGRIGPVTENMRVTSDYFPPDKSRLIYEMFQEDGVDLTEIIYLGKIEYRRKNSGEWTKRDTSAPDDGFPRIPAASKKSPEAIIKYSSRVKDGLTVLESRSNLAFAIRPGLEIRRLTIDKLNRMLKVEHVTHEGPDLAVVYTSIKTYQYDLNDLKIEAPIK